MQTSLDDHTEHLITSPLKAKANVSANTSTSQASLNDPTKRHPSHPVFPQRHPLSISYPLNKVSSEISHLKKSKSYRQALKILIINTTPLIITFLAIFLSRNLSMHFIKEKNNVVITSALGISITLIGVVGVAVVLSLNSGFISQSSQAFGAENTQPIGLYLHRALIINTIALIPGYCILYWSDALFILIGFDLELSQYAQKFSAYCIPGIYAMMLFNTLSSYLYSCDIFFPSSIAIVISSIVFSVLSYFLITKTDMDTWGYAISYNVMFSLASVLLFVYIKIKDPVPGSFFWFKSESFKGIWTLFKHEFFVGSMIFFQWIAYEIIYLVAGRLELVEVTSLTIVYTNSQIMYVVPLSLSNSVLAFVGNSMGQGDIKRAKYYLKAAVMLSLLSLVVVEALYIFLPRQIAEFYTADVETINKTVEIFRIYAFVIPADFVQSILSSGLQAIGKEKLGSIVVLVCYYVIQIPAALVLCFYADLKAKGMIYGSIISLYCLLSCHLFLYFKTDWKEQARIITDRVKNDDNKTDNKCNAVDNV